MTLYSMSFPEWNINERVRALRMIGFVAEYNADTYSVELKYNQCDFFGSAHTEAAKFICDPVYNPKMYNMDPFIGRTIARLHAEFWYWKFNMPFFDLEIVVAEGIQNYINSLDCEEQDEWLEVQPLELKNKVINNIESVFDQDFWFYPTLGKYIIRNLSIPLFPDNKLSWNRIHSLLFAKVKQ